MTYISYSDLLLRRAQNKIAGESIVHKFGFSNSIGVTEGDIWYNGGNYPFPTAAETIRVKAGGNVNDIDTTGSGARTVRILGLDANFDEISEDIALAGASASSATTSSFIRIFRAYVLTSGTYNATNTGDIVIENTTSNVVLANLQAGKGQTQLSMYTVPNGRTAYITDVNLVIEEANKTSDIKFVQHQNADDVSAPYTANRILQSWNQVTGSIERSYRSYLCIPEKTDITFRAVASSGTLSISVDYDMILVVN